SPRRRSEPEEPSSGRRLPRRRHQGPEAIARSADLLVQVTSAAVTAGRAPGQSPSWPPPPPTLPGHRLGRKVLDDSLHRTTAARIDFVVTQEFLPWSFPVQRTEFDTPNHKTTFNITTQGNFRKYFPVPGRNRTEDYTLQEWLTESSVHISEAKRGVGVEDLTQFGSNYCYLSNRSFSPRLLVVRP
uniref:Uncharacterized protein n=1 Tax=Triticum urartu TaxID=4572 RepID=A0A8R7TFR7_TRIUA